MFISIFTACVGIAALTSISSTPPSPISSDSLPGLYPKLTVQPKVDATGDQNATAGTRELEGFPGYYIHVPQQAVGKTKVPLVVMVHGGGRNGSMEMKKFNSLSEKYGMILLTGSSIAMGRWDVVQDLGARKLRYAVTPRGVEIRGFQPRDVFRLDSAIKYALKHQSIDPTRIALVGFSDGGSYSYLLGRSNMGVFSRVAPLSAMVPFYGEGDKRSETQFFISGGLGEGPLANQVTRMAAVLRAEGHSVKTQIGLRGHVDQVEDQDFVWRWLKDSWENPAITSSAPSREDSEILLDSGVLNKLNVFWRGFLEFPDSIRNASRMKHQHEVDVKVGSEWSTVVMMDLKSLSDLHPKINELLTKAGLTVETAETARKSLIEAVYTIQAGFDRDPVDTSSVVGKTIKFKPVEKGSILYRNIEFYKENKDRFGGLFKLGILSRQ